MAPPGRVFFAWNSANPAHTSAWARRAHPTIGVTDCDGACTVPLPSHDTNLDRTYVTGRAAL